MNELIGPPPESDGGPATKPAGPEFTYEGVPEVTPVPTPNAPASPSTAETAANGGPVLVGERKEGIITRPDGVTLSREVTGDGMMQTRVVRPDTRRGYKNYREFAEERGLMPKEEPAPKGLYGRLLSRFRSKK